MGFSSFLDAKKGSSIPAYPYARKDKNESDVVMILPDDKIIEGYYDGYCKIGNTEIYEIIAPYLLGPGATEEDVFNNLKVITFPDGKVITVNQFNYDEKLPALGGISLNDATDLGAKIVTNFDKSHSLIKIVKKYNYNGEKYNDLEASGWCPYQGFFYSSDIDMKEDLRGIK